MARKITDIARNRLAIGPSQEFSSGIVDLLDQARRHSARTVNSIMTATYWEIGRRIAQRQSEIRADYGERVVADLSIQLTARFGNGFSKRNLEQMRLFHRLWPIAQTASAQLAQPSTRSSRNRKTQTVSAQSKSDDLARIFPLS
jgi:hypothetical protein